ncbi:hypothetical protein TREES_T100019438 [Tupaia chinensis]|uniref:Uncharacterized protein n=1 Tax=Tupaia chinensis TaxID=246437 RepID=L9KSK5_TUPCH|nr:hypothetical protein TREES_T100019438 [Tupaia chinensis]
MTFHRSEPSKDQEGGKSLKERLREFFGSHYIPEEEGDGGPLRQRAKTWEPRKPPPLLQRGPKSHPGTRASAAAFVYGTVTAAGVARGIHGEAVRFRLRNLEAEWGKGWQRGRNEKRSTLAWSCPAPALSAHTHYKSQHAIRGAGVGTGGLPWQTVLHCFWFVVRSHQD